MHRGVWFRRHVYPLLVRFCREQHVRFNDVVNRACMQFVGAGPNERLAWESKLLELRRQEGELRQTMRVMLRSGSFLPQYADQLFREKYDTNEPSFVRKGQVPLKALSLKEEDIARRILAERERIAQEIADILNEMLPKKRFRLGRSRACHNRKTNGGENRDGDDS